MLTNSHQPGPCSSKVVGSQGSGRCLANVCHDSTSGCPVQIYNRKGLWRHSSSGHPGELRPVLGCDPCHTETTSQTGTQPTRFVSSEVASVLSNQSIFQGPMITVLTCDVMGFKRGEITVLNKHISQIHLSPRHSTLGKSDHFSI